MVMPGLVDTHIHALRGALTALGLAFPVTASVDDIKAAVKKFIADKKLKKGDWIEGAKWSIDYKKLTAKMLDEVAPDNPVFLHDWTNHLAWVNTAALKAAKIDKDSGPCTSATSRKWSFNKHLQANLNDQNRPKSAIQVRWRNRRISVRKAVVRVPRSVRQLIARSRHSHAGSINRFPVKIGSRSGRYYLRPCQI